MTKMMDESIATDEQIIALLQDTQRVIIILEVTGAELFVEEAYLMENFSLEEIAEAHKRCFFLPKQGIRLIVICGKRLHILYAFIACLNLLAVGAAVRNAAHSTDLGAAVKGAAQILQPIFRDDGIAVKKQQIRPRRNLKPLIAPLGETLILLVVNAFDIILFLEPLGRSVLRAILDDNDFVRSFLGIFAYAFDAELQKVQCVVTQNNNARLMTHFFSPKQICH